MAAARQLLSAEMSKMDLLPAGKMKKTAATLIILLIAGVSATVEDVAATYVFEILGVNIHSASLARVGTPINGGFRMGSIRLNVGSIIEFIGKIGYLDGVILHDGDTYGDTYGDIVGTSYGYSSSRQKIYINGIGQFLHKQVVLTGRVAEGQYIVVQQIRECEHHEMHRLALQAPLMEKQLGDIWIGVGLSTVIFFSMLFTLLVFRNLEKRRKNCRKHVPFRLIT